MSKVKNQPQSHNACRDFSKSIKKFKEDPINLSAIGFGGALQSLSYNLSLLDDPLQEIKDFFVSLVGKTDGCEA